MKRPKLRILDAQGSFESIGFLHGKQFADEIQHYVEERVKLVASGSWSGKQMRESDILDLAESMIPDHQHFDPQLFTEMSALAEGANISIAEAIIVGGFTDFVDTVRSATNGVTPPELHEDDCTAVLVPDSRANGEGFLAQTWDMHDTATDHVLLLRIKPDECPSALIFTTTGCLGQIGMNDQGVAVGINNLTSSTGKVGVVWPSVVRSMLRQESSNDALSVLSNAKLAGAHNYLIMDKQGDGFNIEAMPDAQTVTRLESAPIVHTNHAVSPEAQAEEAERPADLLANSTLRLSRGNELLTDGEIGLERLIKLTQDDEAICRKPEPPHRIESSGAAIMRPATGEFWACWGQPSHNDYELIRWQDG